MQVLEDIHAADNILADPGHAGNILAFNWLSVVPIATATGETRTVKDPDKAGMMLHLMFVTDEGDATFTFDTACNGAGNSTVILSAPGESATFISTDDGSGGDTYNWASIDGTNNGAAFS